MEEEILAKFPDIAAFNATIKNIADVILKKKRDYLIYDPGPDGNCKICLSDEGGHYHHSNGNKYCWFLLYTFEASEEDENKCDNCDKLKEHHHTKKRDGTISKSEWCYDFLLDL